MIVYSFIAERKRVRTDATRCSLTSADKSDFLTAILHVRLPIASSTAT